MKKPLPFMGNLIILCTALLWSTAGVCVKFLPWSPFSIASLRGLICVSVLVLVRLCRSKSTGQAFRIRFSRHNVVAGLFMFLTSTLYMVSIKLTTAANAIVLQYISPILILLYTIVVEKKRPSPMETVLTLVVFLGCVLAFSDRLSGGGMLGNFLALLSGVTFAGMILINRMEKTEPEDGQIIGCSLSFLGCLPFLLTDTSFRVTLPHIAVMLFLGLFQYSLANILFARGIKLTEPTSASLILTMEPIMNPVWVFLILGEAPGRLALYGFVLVIAAVTMYTILPTLRKKPQIQEAIPSSTEL